MDDFFSTLEMIKELDSDKEPSIIYSGMITPDSTLLVSRHTHDYKEHVDKNGETYVLDGGCSYVRTSQNKERAKYITIYDDAPFSTIRKYLGWGTYGKNGDQELHYLTLDNMESAHIRAVLDTQLISNFRHKCMELELEWRKNV